MLRNSETYPDPDKFWPERFEGMDKSHLNAIDPRNLVFGFGRRQAYFHVVPVLSLLINIANNLQEVPWATARGGERVSHGLICHCNDGHLARTR